jgi:uncharacterized protein YjlB
VRRAAVTWASHPRRPRPSVNRVDQLGHVDLSQRVFCEASDTTVPRMIVETDSFGDDGAFPNSPLAVIVYHGVEDAHNPSRCEALFAEHGWLGAWRDGIYPFHHFHSTAHEVLGIVAGSARVLLGGPGGRGFDVRSGDVLVLPAGTGHCNAGSSHDLLVIGAYPNGMEWDLRRGNPTEHDEVLTNIRAVPVPGADPVRGRAGTLLELWR